MRLKMAMHTASALLLAQAGALVAKPVAVGPQTLPLASGWSFAFQEATPADDAATWQPVSLPHSWNRIGQYEPQTGVVAAQRPVDKKQGVGWYRLDLATPDLAGGRRVFLQFDAASRMAQVWLNGQKVGAHAGSFARFRLDVTKALRPGQSNRLLVRVDNTAPTSGSPTADTLPLTGDFFVQGGLYRPVSLIVTAPAHFDQLDAGGSGVYAQTARLTNTAADVMVTARLRNDAIAPRALRLTTRLVDGNGKTAASAVSRVAVKPASTLETKQALHVPAPHPWQGTRSPYLYRLVSELADARGTVLDRSEQNFGIRQIRIDPDKGLILNGVPTPLHGVALHQDFMATGWAMGEGDVASVVATVRDMGANTLRLAHYQHGETIHTLADRYGLIVWDEIPLVTAWTTRNTQTQASYGLVADAQQQLRELIAQNRNHASVAVWGIANEVDFGPNRPGFLNNGTSATPDPTPLLRNLNALAHRLDPSRPTTLATCCEDHGMDQIPTVADITDVAGANRYFGWYYGKAEEMGPHLDHLHAKRPHQPLAVTEYGGGGALSLHTDNVDGGPVDSGGRVQPEEYQAVLHERLWPQLAARPYLWATWVWNGYDFGSTARHEGDATDVNTKGLVSYDGALRKDAFYYYRAQWSAEPTLHIVGRRAANRAYRVTDVKVYSNAAATDLLLDGQSLGVQRQCDNRVCVWRNVALAPGANQLEARASHGGTVVRDAVTWQLAADQADSWRIDAGALVAAPSAAGHFGSDTFFDGGYAASMDQTPRFRPPVLAKIGGTTDRDLVASYRAGTFSYRLPLAAGTYRVTLTFAEPSLKPGQRVFDVQANGKPMIETLDVAQAAGAPLTAITRQFTVQVGNAGLALAFAPRKGEAIVSALAVEALR
jgi:beta-galactosidase